MKAADGNLNGVLSWARSYKFKEQYGLSALTNQALVALHDQMWLDGNTIPGSWSTYWSARTVGYFDLNTLDPLAWYSTPNVKGVAGVQADGLRLRQWCVLQSFGTSQFEACLEEKNYSQYVT